MHTYYLHSIPNTMAVSEFVYGGIFSAYVACFVFIAAYIMIRRTRKTATLEKANQEPIVQEDKKTK